eukprot:7989-Heterococcus_DN1.PRE.2
MLRAVWPPTFTASTSMPSQRSRKLTMSTLLCSAARCSAELVKRPAPRAFTSAPALCVQCSCTTVAV